MLVNGTTLGYTTTDPPTSYTNIPDLKEVPDLGAEPEMVDNTALADTIIHNEQGIGDPGSMEYTFRYDNKNASASYRICKSLVGTLTFFQQELPDGTAFSFSGYPSVRLSGGGVNDPQEFVMSIALQSDITITDPAISS